MDVLTIDELSLLAEEDIADRIGRCRSEMGKRLGDVEWRQRWEVELAFSQRELQIRHARRNHHREYQERERVADIKFMNEDTFLPEYDGNRIPRYVREMLEWN